MAFLTLAMAHGLDLPIINPNVAAMMAAIDSFNVLYNRDEGSKFYVDKYSKIVEAEKNTQAAAPAAKPSDTKSLEYAVLNGIREYAAEATRELLKTRPAMEIVNEILIPALDKVGADFESGKLSFRSSSSRRQQLRKPSMFLKNICPVRKMREQFPKERSSLLR